MGAGSLGCKLLKTVGLSIVRQGLTKLREKQLRKLYFSPNYFILL